MTLVSYTISEAARQTARRSGFDIDNPDQRYPVQNPHMEKVIAERGRKIDPRARLLLKGRKTMDRFLGKGRGHVS